MRSAATASVRAQIAHRHRACTRLTARSSRTRLRACKTAPPLSRTTRAAGTASATAALTSTATARRWASPAWSRIGRGMMSMASRCCRGRRTTVTRRPLHLHRRHHHPARSRYRAWAEPSETPLRWRGRSTLARCHGTSGCRSSPKPTPGARNPPRALASSLSLSLPRRLSVSQVRLRPLLAPHHPRLDDRHLLPEPHPAQQHKHRLVEGRDDVRRLGTCTSGGFKMRFGDNDGADRCVSSRTSEDDVYYASPSWSTDSYVRLHDVELRNPYVQELRQHVQRGVLHPRHAIRPRGRRLPGLGVHHELRRLSAAAGAAVFRINASPQRGRSVHHTH